MNIPPDPQKSFLSFLLSLSLFSSPSNQSGTIKIHHFLSDCVFNCFSFLFFIPILNSPIPLCFLLCNFFLPTSGLIALHRRLLLGTTYPFRISGKNSNPLTDEREHIMSELIEGLPDAVALRCLARVPFYLHPKLELVSRSWRAAIHSPELFKARREVGSSEDLLCVNAFDPENLWQLYDPRRDLWITLPILPSKIRHLSNFGVVSTDGKLFVLGGGSDAVDPLTGDHDGSFATNEVWSYDPVTRQWSGCAPMLVPRAMFACCELDGKIVVAGGFTSCRKSISQAEIYDPSKNVWVPVPDLHRTHNSTCSGVVVEGKLHVMHKGLSTVQVLDHTSLGWTVKDYGWLQGPMAVVQGSLYVMSHGVIMRQDRDGRKVVGSASEFKRRIGCAMFGLGDEIYVIGGVIGPDRWNWDIEPLSDVDVLTVVGERPSWRRVAPMTRCRGTILGCARLSI